MCSYSRWWLRCISLGSGLPLSGAATFRWVARMREEATKREETLSDMRGTQQRPPPCRQPLPNPPGLTLQLRPADELNLIEFIVVTIQEDNKI